MEFLYNDGDSYYFMDTANYEQTHLTQGHSGRRRGLPDLRTWRSKWSSSTARRSASNCRRRSILTVIETEPGLKSATASSVTKPAKTETGLVVQVPPFINEGEKIKVDTSEGAYLSRA